MLPFEEQEIIYLKHGKIWMRFVLFLIIYLLLYIKRKYDDAIFHLRKIVKTSGK